MTASAFQQLTEGRIDPQLLERLTNQVMLVEEELLAQTESPVDRVRRIGQHTLNSGGKRLRPAFVRSVQKATALPFDSHRALRLGAVMEMIHMATLIHDDVVDNSPTRRGEPTANNLFGNTQSILTGDVLLAKAMMLLAQDGDLDVIRAVSEAVVEMAEGEVRELETRGIFDLSEAEHLEVLSLKTASFIRACCETGAYVAGAEPSVCLALREYGSHVGLAFQIIDDILDYRGKGLETGKAQATDFREGQATLPLIRLEAAISDEEKQVLKLKFGAIVGDDEIRMICGWMESRGSFQSAANTAVEHVMKAKAAIQVLPANPAKDLLEAVADYIVERRS